MSIVDYFIPEHYKKEKLAYSSVRMILKVNMVAFMIVACLLPYFLSCSFYPGAFIMGYSMVMAFLFLFVVYFSTKTTTVGNFFAANALVIFTALITQTGGVHSPFLLWLLTVAPVSILSLPKNQGYFWTGLSIVSFVSIVGAQLSGIQFNHTISENTVTLFQLFSYSFVSLVFIFIVQSFKNGYRKAKHQLEESNIGLKDSNEELDRFASIASHDLKSPLRSIVSFASLIKLKYGDILPEEGQEYLKIMSDNARQMNSLIEDILEYSKGNDYEPMKGKVSLNDVVDHIVSEIKMNEQFKNAQIVGGNLPDLFADSTLIKQLFQNIISNGLKYNNNEHPKVEITCKKESDTLHIEVTDNGIGIEKEYQDKIFEMFKRLHGKGTYEGTGIGLAICKKIMNQYNGKIWVSSKVGLGSTFHIVLPKELIYVHEAQNKPLLASVQA